MNSHFNSNCIDLDLWIEMISCREKWWNFWRVSSMSYGLLKWYTNTYKSDFDAVNDTDTVTVIYRYSNQISLDSSFPYMFSKQWYQCIEIQMNKRFLWTNISYWRIYWTFALTLEYCKWLQSLTLCVNVQIGLFIWQFIYNLCMQVIFWQKPFRQWLYNCLLYFGYCFHHFLMNYLIFILIPLVYVFMFKLNYVIFVFCPFYLDGDFNAL